MPQFSVEVQDFAGQLAPSLQVVLYDLVKPRVTKAIDDSAGLQDLLRAILVRRAGSFELRARAENETLYLADVAGGLQLTRQQLLPLIERGEPCRTVRFGGQWIPLLHSSRLAEIEMLMLAPDSTPESPVLLPLPHSKVAPAEIPDLMLQPLAFFLSARLFGSRLSRPSSEQFAQSSAGGLFGSSAGAPNVEVTTNTANWQVIYTYPHQALQIGFGGPTTPVFGHVRPGAWFFGITNSTRIIWDNNTRWLIPPTLQATPPYKIFLPL